jgi:hypothetical protein
MFCICMKNEVTKRVEWEWMKDREKNSQKIYIQWTQCNIKKKNSEFK